MKSSASNDLPDSIMDVEGKTEILKKIDILSFFHDSTLERLAQESNEITLQKEDVLFEEGTTGTAMYIVLQGEIQIFRGKDNLASMSPGSYFGEMSLIESSAPRTAGARANCKSLLMEINENQFQSYFATQPQALMAIMKTISARFRKSSQGSNNNARPSPATREPRESISPELDNSPHEIYFFDSQNLKIKKINVNAFNSVGYDDSEIDELKFIDLAKDFSDETLDHLLQPLLKKTMSVVSFDSIIWRKDGSFYPVEIKLQIVDPRADNPEIMARVQDISERKQFEETIRQMAYYDALTGLPNRNLLNDRIAVAMTHALRNKEKAAILFLDLDHFKKVNDTLGHEAGDKLLQEVARTIKDSLRQNDTVARMGGDEFIILATGIQKAEDAAKLANKILNKINTTYTISGHEIYISCSIGISIFPDDGREINSLLKNSDLAMYRAKDQGRNNFQLHTPAMTTGAMARMKLESNLRKALEREEFLLYYQPKINLEKGTVVGMEALVRWESKDLGVVSPDSFIPLAEETRLILPLGEWVLREACKQIKIWSEMDFPQIIVAVNLSVVQFTQTDLVANVKEIIKESNINPAHLELEITESFLMKDTDAAIDTLNELNGIGINLSIDDFGTGYSSFSYLKNLPINALKIDKIFIHEFAQETNSAIIKAMVALGQTLSLKIVAEGVETVEQKQFLELNRCDEAQGYYFGKPLPVEQATKFLKENKIFLD